MEAILTEVPAKMAIERMRSADNIGELAKESQKSSASGETASVRRVVEVVSGRTSFPDRARFTGYAAEVMRGLLVDL